MKEIFVILHNIRSLHNVGSIFRTSDAAGVKKIYLTGYTPALVDRFGKIRPEIHKTALGAETTIKWQKYKNIGKLIAKLKQRTDLDNFYQGLSLIIGVEQAPNSVNYKKFTRSYDRVPSRMTGQTTKHPLALIFGNEVRGLSKQILKKCDSVIEIPMHGKKESLNVSVSAGIILFSLK